MTIAMDDTIVAIWYVQLSSESDWMAGMNRTEQGLRVQYRFRYYETHGAWDGLDRKNWYDMHIKQDTQERVIDVLRMVIAAMKERGALETFEILRGPQETLEEFMERFGQQPFAHMRYEPAP